MGLSIAYSLFYQVLPNQIFDALQTFYVQRISWLDRTGQDQDEDQSLTLHEPENGWTVFDLGRGWWRQNDIQCEAALFVIEMLSCSGIFVRVYDGDYWEYELFENGRLIDHFVQEAGVYYGPPGKGGNAHAIKGGNAHAIKGGNAHAIKGGNAHAIKGGNAHAIVSVFPWLKIDVVAPYLIQAKRDDPDDWHGLPEDWHRLQGPVRPGDEFGRYDQCAVIDFVRMLGVSVNIVNRRVTLVSPIREQFWIKPYDNRH